MAVSVGRARLTVGCHSGRAGRDAGDAEGWDGEGFLESAESRTKFSKKKTGTVARWVQMQRPASAS